MALLRIESPFKPFTRMRVDIGEFFILSREQRDWCMEMENYMSSCSQYLRTENFQSALECLDNYLSMLNGVIFHGNFKLKDPKRNIFFRWMIDFTRDKDIIIVGLTAEKIMVMLLMAVINCEIGGDLSTRVKDYNGSTEKFHIAKSIIDHLVGVYDDQKSYLPVELSKSFFITLSRYIESLKFYQHFLKSFDSKYGEKKSLKTFRSKILSSVRQRQSDMISFVGKHFNFFKKDYFLSTLDKDVSLLWINAAYYLAQSSEDHLREFSILYLCDETVATWMSHFDGSDYRSESFKELLELLKKGITSFDLHMYSKADIKLKSISLDSSYSMTETRAVWRPYRPIDPPKDQYSHMRNRFIQGSLIHK